MSTSANSSPVHVAKFGGTSVGTPARVQRVVELVMHEAVEGRRVVVSSAFGGVTDRLFAAVEAAVARTGEHRAILREVRERHAEALLALAKEDERAELADGLDALFTEIGELLYGVYLLRECNARFRDAIVSAGERASVPLVAAAFRSAGHAAVALDATAFIRTDDSFGEAAVDFETTRQLVSETFEALPPGAVAVVTGFVASTADGVTTTLGRSGSDYTATILAGALGAQECVIWTDVDGVLSADPRVVPDAFSLPRLSYEEAAELAHFGAKVLHPRTMRPLQAQGIPLRIKNTMRPEADGTLIGPAEEESAGEIKAVTAIRDVALVRVLGGAVLEVSDLAHRVFGPLAEAGIPVYLVAQASSEGSLGFAVRQLDATAAARVLTRALAREIERGDVLGVEVESGGAVIAAVGAGMHTSPGLAGQMFATLGRAHVNLRAFAQGGGDHACSALVADDDVLQGVRALHETFARRRLRAHVVVIGAGVLGQRVLRLLAAQSDTLREQNLNLRLVGLADSRRLLWNESGLNPEEAHRQLKGSMPSTLDTLVDGATSARLERLIVVDATPSADVAARHAELLAAGIAVVTPNKEAMGRSVSAWRQTEAAARAGEAPYLYDASVGAGLGVVARLRDLLRTGDTVLRIEGVLSGTLAFVFSQLRAGVPFSEAVAQARDAGLTEPDVRDDLSGRDVARKLALLAREMGIPADIAEAHIESLVPDEVATVPLDVFWERLSEFDLQWADRLAKPAPAEAGGDAQYIARLYADGLVEAAVEPLAASSPLAGLRGAEVAVAFHTERYGEHPLLLRGPGANADVTASVLLADIVRAAEAMR
ncbi:MAG: bifunctional aspartate kinase/homoserine dehydrogenase I [Rubricoccaceae bacterium]